MTSEVEISEYGNLLIYKKQYTPAFIKSTIEQRTLDGLMIFDHLDPLLNVDFLYECFFLKGLVVTMRYD